MVIEVECDLCEDIYESYPSEVNTMGNNFCSRDCYLEYEDQTDGRHLERYITLTCSWCGDTKQVPPSHPSAQSVSEDGYSIDNNFCDKECESQWKSKHWRGEDHPNWSGGLETCICDVCDDTYDVKPSEVDKSSFCSRECQIQAQTVDTDTYSCDLCGDPFERKPYKVKTDHAFCSMDCRLDWLSEQRLGENNPAYEPNSTSEMGIDYEKVKRQAMERDGYKCKICSMSREEHYEEYRCDLIGHHIFPRRLFDNVNDSNYPENVIILCHRCHGPQLGREDGTVVHPDTGDVVELGDLSTE